MMRYQLFKTLQSAEFEFAVKYVGYANLNLLYTVFVPMDHTNNRLVLLPFEGQQLSLIDLLSP